MKADYSQEALLGELEQRLLQRNVRKSAKDFADLLADDFIEFGSSGRIFDKQQIIECLQNETIEPAMRLSLINFNTLVLAEGVILVTYRIVRYGSSDKQLRDSLRSSIWKLIDDRWKLVFHQGTLTQEP